LALKIDLRVGETVSFDSGRISITLLEKSGQRARLDIEADPSVRIDQPKQRASEAARNGLTLAPA
jgi:hypothetical protein